MIHSCYALVYDDKCKKSPHDQFVWTYNDTCNRFAFDTKNTVERLNGNWRKKMLIFWGTQSLVIKIHMNPFTYHRNTSHALCTYIVLENCVAPSGQFAPSLSKVNWGLEGTSDIMVTPKLGVASILRFSFIIQKRQYSERVDRNPAPCTANFIYI